MIGYYRGFIRGYPTLLASLTDLLRRDRKWEWSAACGQTFNRVKYLLCDGPTLRIPDLRDPLCFKGMLSHVGVVMMLQVGEDQAKHPVAFFSQKLTPAKRNYSVLDQELLEILLISRQFDVYLPSHWPVIKIYSDHHPLQLLSKFLITNQRLSLCYFRNIT